MTLTPAETRQAAIEGLVSWAERRTAPVVSMTVLGMVLEHLDADTLAQLAAVRRSLDRALAPRLSEEAVEELARMAAEGLIPTIGWWRHHSAAVSP